MAFKKPLSIALLSLIAALPAFSQGDGWKKEFNIGLMANTGNDIKSMKKGGGWTAGLAFSIPLKDNLEIRPHLTTVVFEGVEGSGLLKERPHFFAGIDAKKFINDEVYVLGGFVCMKWNQTPVPSAPNFKNDGTRSSDLGGIKLGIRGGVGYQISKTFSAEATWHVIEANQRFVPSWASIGVTMRF